MATQNERITKLENTIYGGDEPGMRENMRTLARESEAQGKDIAEIKEELKKISGHTGPTRSELEALKRAIFEKLDLDALGNSKEYTAQEHPGRRVEDSASISDKVLKYLLDKVVPAIITWTILGWLAFQVAVNNHLVIQV